MGPPFGSTRDLLWLDLSPVVFMMELILDVFILKGSFFKMSDILDFLNIL